MARKQVSLKKSSTSLLSFISREKDVHDELVKLSYQDTMKGKTQKKNSKTMILKPCLNFVNSSEKSTDKFGFC